MLKISKTATGSQWSSASIAVLSVVLMVSVLSSCSDTVSTSSDEIDENWPGSQSVSTLSEIADSIRTFYDLPALGGAIVTISGVVDVGIAGERRYGSGIEAERGDRWSLGSNTKAITGVIAGMAVESGYISWDSTIEESFPELLGTMRDEYRSITLKDLLGHRSGLIDGSVPGVEGSFSDDEKDSPTIQREKMAEWVLSQPPNSPKGIYHYTDLGYAIAAAMLERAIEQPFEQWAKEKLTSILSLQEFGYGAHVEAGSSDQPVPHFLQNRNWEVVEAHENSPFRRPAGGAYGSLEDWGKIIAEMIKARGDFSRLITRSTSDVVNSKLSVLANGNHYSMGWIILGETEWAGGETWYHTGSNWANHSMAWVAPEAGVGFIAVTNSFDPDGRTIDALTSMVFRLLERWDETQNTKIGEN